MKDYEGLLTELNAKIWDYAELKFHETRSMTAHTKVLEEAGFTVVRGVAGIPTAFTAAWGEGKPVIGILAEYDALNGLSQVANVSEKKLRPETENGHGCGHCLLGTASVGGAMMLKDMLEDTCTPGTVVLVGCPAEEGGSGKTFLTRAGVFDGLDIALTWHPGGGNSVFSGSFMANCQVRFRFRGVSAHAACAPQLGRSALDAMELMDVGVNYLREHMEATDRIHYAILNTGGSLPNVVQNFAEVRYLIRSTSNEKVKKLYERVCRVAKGAAEMTETEVEIVFEKACSDSISNAVLEKLLYESMQEEPYPSFSDEELTFAREIRATYTDETMDSDLCVLGCPEFDRRKYLQIMKEAVLVDSIKEYHHLETTIPGSSDVGDCSQIVPTAQFVGACFTPGTPGHSWQMVTQGKTSYASKVMVWSAKVLARAGYQAILHPEMIAAARQELREVTGGREYRCPIPDEIMPPIQ